MRSNKKAIIICICAVLMVMCSVAGTLAYITAEDTNVNTFTVGKVKLELDEAKFENGTSDPNERVKENTYKLIPGKDVFKDPTVTVKKGSEEAYVRMILTIYNEPVMGQIVNSQRHGLGGDYANLLAGWSDTIWLYDAATGCTVNSADGTISFEFRYFEPVNASAEEKKLTPLFNGLVVPASLTGEELALLESGGFKIEVEAHAIQSDGFADANAAWAAFDDQMEAIATDSDWADISNAAATATTETETEAASSSESQSE